MADEADIASMVEAQHLSMAIQAQRAGRVQLQATGNCHYCDAEVSHLFCDADCRNDFEREATLRKKLGLPSPVRTGVAAHA